MCSRRFLPTLGLSVALCLLAFGGYYQYTKATVDGGYTEWTVWSNCTKECGEGVQMRYRRCEQPPPGKYGKDCYRFGPDNDQKPCFLRICPVDGKFGDWSAFSECNKPCGGGIRVRTRQCNNPPAVFGGKPCEGPTREEEPCNTQICPINGGYTQWSAYGPCSVTCGKGTKTRTRSCTNPPPSNGGNPCAEPASETVECNNGACQPPEPAKQNESPQNMPQQHDTMAKKPEQTAQNPANQAAQKSEGQAGQQPQDQQKQS